MSAKLLMEGILIQIDETKTTVYHIFLFLFFCLAVYFTVSSSHDCPIKTSNCMEYKRSKKVLKQSSVVTRALTGTQLKMARLCLVIFLAIYAFGLVASNLEREERKINWGKNAWGAFAPDGYFNGKPQPNKVTKSLNQYRLNY